jgi:hypothetical protein
MWSVAFIPYTDIIIIIIIIIIISDSAMCYGR